MTRFQSSPWQPHSTEFEVKEYGECRLEWGGRGRLAQPLPPCPPGPRSPPPPRGEANQLPPPTPTACLSPGPPVPPELPSFDVLLTPTKKFFYLSDDSLTIVIESR